MIMGDGYRENDCTYNYAAYDHGLYYTFLSLRSYRPPFSRRKPLANKTNLLMLWEEKDSYNKG